MSFSIPAHKNVANPAGQVCLAKLVGDIGHTEVGVPLVPPPVPGAARQAVNAISYDFDYVHYGHFVLVEPISKNARDWASLYLEDADGARHGRAYVVEAQNWALVQDEILDYGLTFRRR